jgi:hypothetical protein
VIVLVCLFILFLFEFQGLLSSEVVKKDGPNHLTFSYEGYSGGGSHTLTNISLKCSENVEISSVNTMFDVLLL